MYYIMRDRNLLFLCVLVFRIKPWSGIHNQKEEQKNNALYGNESAEGVCKDYLFGIFNFMPL